MRRIVDMLDACVLANDVDVPGGWRDSAFLALAGEGAFGYR
jgi:hypothetical protein